jgi:hypothetical protein
MKKIKLYSHLLFFLLNCSVSFSQESNKEVKAKINVEQVENMLTIIGTAENLDSEFKNISFKLTVFRNNKSNSNRSKNSQDGRVTLKPIQKVNLSKTQININKDDQIILLLLIYDESDVIIGKDRVVIGGDEEVDVTIIKPKDGLEMIGIVSNETKTRLGNEFYDYFYYEYSKLKINSNKVVSIGEELTVGITTKIIVSVNGDVIDEFIARPDDEFLKYMATVSSDNVFIYFKNLEKQALYLTRY